MIDNRLHHNCWFDLSLWDRSELLHFFDDIFIFWHLSGGKSAATDHNRHETEQSNQKEDIRVVFPFETNIRRFLTDLAGWFLWGFLGAGGTQKVLFVNFLPTSSALKQNMSKRSRGINLSTQLLVSSPPIFKIRVNKKGKRSHLDRVFVHIVNLFSKVKVDNNLISSAIKDEFQQGRGFFSFLGSSLKGNTESVQVCELASVGISIMIHFLIWLDRKDPVLGFFTPPRGFHSIFFSLLHSIMSIV
mmetsp:Transcript_30215/g.46852  ORF Transcript_30215/g.46852 Transcript_30215/m.46852 type:complete len:245 (+) Transcript_30215:293-1027(+)